MKENFTYLLIETSDEIQNAIANVDKIINEQTSLVALIESNDNDKKFDAFCQAIKDETNSTKAQRNTLAFRKECLLKLIEKCQANEEVADAITLFCKTFNVFDVTQIENDDNAEQEEVNAQQEVEENEDVKKAKIIDLPIK